VRRDGRGRLTAEPAPGREGLGHDNAERLPHVCRFLNERVLPLVGDGADAGAGAGAGARGDVAGVTGTWRIELHDAYTYLPGRAGYEEVLTFGRAADAEQRRVALTTTGDRDPARNARLRACVWSLGRPDVARMHITSIAQMSPEAALAAHPTLRGALHAPFAIADHFRYRYQVNIVGNTACWSRLPMLLSSGCVAVHVRHADAMWYYPLLREGRHYVGADSVEGPDLLRAHAFCRAHDRRCAEIAKEANALAADLFHVGAAATYLAALLRESAHLGRA
jgi:hypothetical protein